MLDLYFLRLSVYKAGQGEYRLSKSFATDSLLKSTTFLLIRAFHSLEIDFEISFQYFQHLFLPHRFNATVYYEGVAVQGEVKKAEAKVSGSQDTDFVIRHLADNEHSAEMMFHEIQLQVVLCDCASACRMGGSAVASPVTRCEQESRINSNSSQLAYRKLCLIFQRIEFLSENSYSV